MIVYLSILVMTLGVSLLGQKKNTISEERTRTGIRFSALICILALFVFFFVVRWNVGTDFPNYYRRYTLSNNVELQQLVGTRDWGFYVLTAILYKLWPGNYIFYSFIIALIIYTPILISYKQYASHYTFTLFLYITMCLYTWPYNGTRQAIAVGFLFLGTHALIHKNKWIPFLISVFIAYLFHSSALFIFPFIMISRRKAWSKGMNITAIVLLTSILILPSIWRYIINFLDLIGQTKMADDYSDLSSLRSGISAIRILVAVVPVVISFLYIDKLRKINPDADFISNMCLFNCIFLLCAYRLTTLSRFAIYFNVFLPLLVPDFVYVFNGKQQKSAIGLICILYLMHMIVLLPNDSDLIPYRFIFNQ